MAYVSILGLWHHWRWWLATMCLVVGSVSLASSAPPFAHYTKALMLGPDTEWRFVPLVVDVNGDGSPDLVATARLADPALHLWWGDGRAFTPVTPTWTDIGYAALATGDINHDGAPDLVLASHFGKVQTLLSKGQGGFSETILPRQDGWVAAQLADLTGDGELDFLLLGFQKAGIEIWRGNGRGDWTFQTRLPDRPPGKTVPGRALAVGISIMMGIWTSSPCSTAGGFISIMAMGRGA